MTRNSRRKFILVVFNSTIASGCDYALQTIRILSKQHTVIGFCLGEPVSWVNIWKKSVLITYHGITVIRPFFVIPGQRFSCVRNCNYFLNAALIKLYINLTNRKKHLLFWFFEPFNIPSILGLFRSYETIYDCVDYFPGFSDTAERSEEAILSKIDHVFANSQTLTSLMEKKRKDVIFVPLGFSETLFTHHRKHGNKKNSQRNIVGYVGSISSRFDFHLLKRVVGLCPDVLFWFIGPLEKDVYGYPDELLANFDALVQQSNVIWTDFIPKSEIPKAIASFDIGIIPYQTKKSFNAYSFPMKTMEYFYSGKPVIATPLEELKRFSKYIKIGQTPEKWEKHITSLLSSPWPISYQKEQRIVALTNNWEKKIDAILESIS